MERFKSQIPKFVTNYFNLSFTTTQAKYEPGREPEEVVKLPWGKPQGADNVVYSNFPKQEVVASKQVFEQRYLIQDSLRKLDWRITGEIRTIENFKCRKAVAVMLDSVYVVAFYTDDIAVSGGPEMFSGLPGMILELAIPRLYTTWVATKIETISIPETALTVPDKGKKTTEKELQKTLISTMKDWGDMGQRSIWWCLI